MINLNSPIPTTSNASRGRDKMVEYVPADGNRLKFFQVGTIADPMRLILQDFVWTGINRTVGTFIEVMLQMEDSPAVWKTIARMRLEGKEMKVISHSFTGTVATYKAPGESVMRLQTDTGDSADFVFTVTAVGREQREL